MLSTLSSVQALRCQPSVGRAGVCRFLTRACLVYAFSRLPAIVWKSVYKTSLHFILLTDVGLDLLSESRRFYTKRHARSGIGPYKTRGNAQPVGRSLCRSKLRFYFLSVFPDQSSPNYVCMRLSDHSFQSRFPLDDILLCSGDIRNQIAKLSQIAPRFLMFWAAKFWSRRDPKFLPKFYKSGSSSIRIISGKV